MMLVNLVQILGWGEFFPWAVPVVFALGKSPFSEKIHLRPVSPHLAAGGGSRLTLAQRHIELQWVSLEDLEGMAASTEDVLPYV